MKPLTIKELRALPIGDWVWAESKDYGKMYAIIEDYNNDEILLNSISLFGWLNYSDYGKTWVIYKNKEQAEYKEDEYELAVDGYLTQFGNRVLRANQLKEKLEKEISKKVAKEILQEIYDNSYMIRDCNFNYHRAIDTDNFDMVAKKYDVGVEE